MSNSLALDRCVRSPVWSSNACDPRAGVDLAHRSLERAGDILIRRLFEADMTVAELDEREVRRLGRRRLLAEHSRRKQAAADGPDHSGAGPGHALEEPASIDAVVAWKVRSWNILVLVSVNIASHGILLC